MKIANREISLNHPPLIIAEIGINHQGSLKIAKKMVSDAAKSGAEIIKHQTHFIEDEMSEEAKTIFPPNAEVSIWDVMEQNSLSPEDEIKLKEYTEHLGLIYISTPFSRKATDFLDSIGVPAFKIGSGECDNTPLIRHIAAKGKPVILSTGMNSISSIRKSVQILENAGIDYALLECTNLYPSPPENVSLKGITELRNAFPDVIIGFSDHSIGPTMAIAAMALGSSIIERHFTDSRYRLGPDISCSMDPSELRFLIDKSQEIHIALNNPKGRTTNEEAVYKFARGSIVADQDIIAGTTIEEKHIWARRPGNGEIPAYDFDNLIGKKIKVSVNKNQQLSWNMIEK
jgi:N-acetylneuraminate synthase